MRLASGIAPVRRMLDRGIRVCVGTDGSASNDTQDLLETLKQAALLANLVAQRPGAIAPMRLLRLATTSAARALSWPEIGSLKVGQKADLTVFDLDSARTSPVHNPLAAIIYSASGVRARHVFVNGRMVVENFRVTTIDEDSLVREANAMATSLIRRTRVIT
jgi:5-methylthioadenosine/S-adenosylhomocysteine deaminase